MTTRERMRRVLSGQVPDRIPLCEICFWPETVERWRGEGLPRDVDPLRWLDMDVLATSWFDSSLRLEEETLSEDEDTVTVRDQDGATVRRWKTKTAVRQHLDYLVKTPDDWLRVRDRLSFSPQRIPPTYAETWRQSQQDGSWLAIVPGEPIWWVLMVMGFEAALPFMLDYPDVVQEMVAAQTELSLQMIDAACEIGKPDALWFFSDLGFRNGMLFSPAMFRALVLPYHQRITTHCHELGLNTVFHCCGDCRQVIPLLIDGGFDCVQPLEARAGNDVRQFKSQYGGQIALFGNISVERLSGSEEEAEDEVRTKLEVAVPGGGYIFHSDHSVPPGVSLANYRRALDVAREIGTYE